MGKWIIIYIRVNCNSNWSINWPGIRCGGCRGVKTKISCHNQHYGLKPPNSTINLI